MFHGMFNKQTLGYVTLGCGQNVFVVQSKILFDAGYKEFLKDHMIHLLCISIGKLAGILEISTFLEGTLLKSSCVKEELICI